MFDFAAVFLSPVLFVIWCACARCVCVGGGGGGVGLIMQFSEFLFLLLICCDHFVLGSDDTRGKREENLHSFGAMGPAVGSSGFFNLERFIFFVHFLCLFFLENLTRL